MRFVRAAAASCAALGALLAAADERSFTLVTVNGAVPEAQRVLRVTKGDKVTVTLTSNVPGEAHLHAYKLAAALAPGKRAQWTFTAHATGRYRVEWHAAGDKPGDHHHAPLATLEVMPR